MSALIIFDLLDFSELSDFFELSIIVSVIKWFNFVDLMLLLLVFESLSFDFFNKYKFHIIFY